MRLAYSETARNDAEIVDISGVTGEREVSGAIMRAAVQQQPSNAAAEALLAVIMFRCF